MELARINLTTNTIEADAEPFAQNVMKLPPDTWANLTERGYPNVGYLPVVDEPVQIDPMTQREGDKTLTIEGDQVVRKSAVIDLPSDQVAAKQRAAAKIARDQAVAAIKVTTAAGNTFDGDETSQTRMARAIIALQETGVPSVTWVLANNAPIQATASELSEALALAGAAQAAIWVL